MLFFKSAVPIPWPLCSGSTRTMPTQAKRPPYTIVVAVPRTTPPTSATKHPSRLAFRNIRQSASVWFHPAMSFSRIPAGISSSVMVRICISRCLLKRAAVSQKSRQSERGILQHSLKCRYCFFVHSSTIPSLLSCKREARVIAHREKSIASVDELELLLSEPHESAVRALAQLPGDVLV